MDIHAFWKAVLEQDAAALPAFFTEDAIIRWPCSNEQFTVSEYVRANCGYPGCWAGEVERLVQTPEGLATVVRVYMQDGSASFHAASFFTLQNGLIAALDEYWGDDGPAPDWRREMGVGRPIR